MDNHKPILNKLFWPTILMLLFLTACSRASVQDYDNPDFVEVTFHGLDSESSHSITNLEDELFYVNPMPVIDYYDNGTWREVDEEWGTGTNSLGAYPIFPESTEDIMPYFSSATRSIEDPGSYRIRHHAWFGNESPIPDAGDDETFTIVIPFEIDE